MTKQEYQELLSFKEERISMWEQFGCVMSGEGSVCEFIYPEVRA